MCNGIRSQETYHIRLEDIHPDIRHHYYGDITTDKCIGEEVKEILSKGIATIGHSCCGHGEIQSQVFIRKHYVNLARSLGYRVYVVQDPNWTQERVEYSVPLKSGTKTQIHLPYSYCEEII